METAVAVREGQVLTQDVPSPIFRGAQMVRSLTDYRELQSALDQAMPDQVMTLDGRPFRKKGYWRAIAVAFNLTVEPITDPQQERSVVGALDDGTENYVYAVSYRAMAPNGRSAVGDGTCAASEKQRGRMKATEHNVRSHAHTRAFNRAVSNLVGFGEVSAEEIEREEHGSATTETTTPARAAGAVTVTDVAQKSGTAKNGKAWTSHTVTFSDGRALSTFDQGIAAKALKAKAGGLFVRVQTEQRGQYVNLTGLDLVADQDAPSGPVSTINDEGQKKLWAVAEAHGWDEAGVMMLLRSHGFGGMSEVTTAKSGEVMNSLKRGPQASEPGSGK